ncbi:MAG TPA: hypothetical protein VMS75_04730 [Terriglobales bacterium]|nr:hypothetical protein [Terriglobales bacterium]
MTHPSRNRALSALALAAGAAALAVPARAADVFRARLLTGKAPIEPPAVALRIEVQSYTAPEELILLQQALNTSDDAFLTVFQKLNKGVVRFMDSRGWNLPIHAAQIVTTDKGRKLTCVLLRQVWDPGSQFVRTGPNFFMVLELNLPTKGVGDGRLYEDASVRFVLPDGKIEMTKYEAAPKILIQVNEVKPK